MKTDTHDTHHKGCHCHHRMTHFLWLLYLHKMVHNFYFNYYNPI